MRWLHCYIGLWFCGLCVDKDVFLVESSRICHSVGHHTVSRLYLSEVHATLMG